MSSKISPLSYGAFVTKNITIFKIHAPQSTKVHLVIFNSPEDKTGVEHRMTKQDNGDFMSELNDAGVGTIYGFRLEGPLNNPENSKNGASLDNVKAYRPSGERKLNHSVSLQE